MSQIEYYVEAESTCARCDGTGMIMHPLWEEFEKEFHSIVVRTEDADKAMQWWNENGYYESPDIECECPDCDGMGLIIERVLLEDAIQAIMTRDQA